MTDRLREAARALLKRLDSMRMVATAAGGRVGWYETLRPYMEELRAALDAEQDEPTQIPCPQCGRKIDPVTAPKREPQPSPSDEEQARNDPIVKACQGCQRCDYDEAEGGLVAHCESCLVQIARAVHAHYYAALAEARREGRERCAAWHDAEAEACHERLKEITANPLRHERCQENGSIDYFRDLAIWQADSAAAIRALEDE